MGVIIKGMEMPENCMECDLKSWNPDEYDYVCPFSGIMALNIGVQYDCPLVEISTPHGRLIDGDKLLDKMSNYTDNEGAKMPFGYDDTLIHRDSACFMIENAPTLVESEKWGREVIISEKAIIFYYFSTITIATILAIV